MNDVVDRLRAAGCVFAEEEAQLLSSAARSEDELEALVRRRVTGEPLEHVVGWAEFCGLRIIVEPGVFVPRPRSELLVRVASQLARPGAVVVDLCCGAGAIGAALSSYVEGLEVHAADIDPLAVRCARRNLPGGHVYEGDLDGPLPTTLRGRVDILVANVPYVPTSEISLMPAEARVHEPRTALDGGADGLDVLRRVVAAAPPWLAPGGAVLVETSRRQVTTAVGAFAAHGLVARPVHDDELDATVVVGLVSPSRGRGAPSSAAG